VDDVSDEALDSAEANAGDADGAESSAARTVARSAREALELSVQAIRDPVVRQSLARLFKPSVGGRP
jgi:hypothetical protein